MQETTMLQTGNGRLGPKIFQQMDHELQHSFTKFNGKTRCGESGSSDVTQMVRCACCDVAEDCTAAYILCVRAAHCGSWVCGLCAEAVGERLRHDPGAGMEAALRWHMAVCRDFNATTRMNPKLSLAGSMRDIARRSFNRRASSTATCHDELRAAKTMARSMSCQPRFLA
ncbi:hypothetical protein SORBI_3009G075300 [Sorghum bicolor]|uniref:DUF1677 family protein n=2 Tax=Sorghum bicolor TaxID=4558 RepID=A0A1Z5R2E1_SORBI|nr:hypothetical protein SORBI_3009G075300 [Sorghum bicolor]